ncbi:choice-of-anchor D domain-containing protein, partial [Bacteroidetes/Chlorobi group bacterium ChocPot_Mid]
LGNGVYEEEFRITFPVNGKMAVNESKTLRVKFNPLKEGLRQAELVIYSNADIKIQKVNLTGTGTNAVKKISFVGDTLVKFDTVEVGSTKELKIRYQNSGNVIFKLNKVELKGLTSPADFILNEIISSDILPGTVSEVSMSFSPKEVGLHEAEIIIKSDAEDAIIKISGFAIPPISVEELIGKQSFFFETYPNPCSDMLYIRLFDSEKKIKAKDEDNYFIRICDVYGNERMCYDNRNTVSKELLTVPVFGLENGVYFLEIRSGCIIENRKFLILK